MLMEDSSSPTMNKDVSNLDFEPPTPSSKKRKLVVEKRVVRLRIGDDDDHKLSPPSDSWSWRKYGQKPIKGSPHPRGYYRCSTAKGCSAKKQVERCKSDASVLIVTYTSSHNHPQKLAGSHTQNPKQTQQQQISGNECLEQDGSSQYQEAARDRTYRPNVEALNPTDDDMVSGLVLPGEQSAGHVVAMDRTTTSAEVVDDEECYDFFDELEELWPTMSLFSYGLQEHQHQQHQLVQ